MLGDVTYNSCTRIANDSANTIAFCSVSADDSGNHIQDEGKWGVCEPECQPDNCLTDQNKCIGTRSHEKGKIQSNETHLISFDARTEAPCVFPFKENNKIYNSCHRGDGDEVAWCATSVDENFKIKTWGYCSESCLNEDIAWLNKDSSTVSIVIISITILIVSAIIMIYFCQIPLFRLGNQSIIWMNELYHNV